jgi:hypothetical protein
MSIYSKGIVAIELPVLNKSNTRLLKAFEYINNNSKLAIELIEGCYKREEVDRLTYITTKYIIRKINQLKNTLYFDNIKLSTAYTTCDETITYVYLFTFVNRRYYQEYPEIKLISSLVKNIDKFNECEIIKEKICYKHLVVDETGYVEINTGDIDYIYTISVTDIVIDQI